MEKIDRFTAMDLGNIYYYTGKPCKHGHVSKRLVVNASCYQCTLDGVKKYNKANRPILRERINRGRKLAEKNA